MITRLHLRNFRRHTDTELCFGAQDQLIAITGVNGAGKTTLLESLLFALYGETRTGRRGLDALVTRGHELEGVEVTLELTIAGSSYRVQRRRVEGTSSALMYCDGQLLCEGPAAVDVEVRNLLGMDAAGFKLAVIAKQKELHGLTALSKKGRRQMLARLLRVDVLERAGDAAHQELSRATEVLEAMGPAPDLAAQEAAATEAAVVVTQLEASLAVSETALAEAEAALEHQPALEARYRAAQDLLARSQGALGAAQAALSQLDAELEATPVAEEPRTAGVRPEREVLTELRALDAARAQAAADQEILAAHAALTQTHREVCESIDRLRPHVSAVDVARTQTRATEALAARDAATEAHHTARDAVAVAETEQRAAREQLRRLESLEGEAVCPACAQPVSPEHLAGELEAARTELERLDAAIGAARELEGVRAGELSERTAAAEQAGIAHTQAQAQAERAEAARVEMAELERRRDSYELRLTRELPTPADQADLADRHRSLEGELVAARRLDAARQQWREQQARHQALATQRTEAAGRVAELERAVAAHQIPAELSESWAELGELSAARDAEADLVAELRTQLAGARALAQLSAERAQDAASFAQRRQLHADRARVAAYTKNVLYGVHATLSGELRPGLEGALCELLTRLSEGRFSAARLDEDYEVSVLDDGAYRPLSELSGGEADLVALCLRLALASVVAERHGSDALGLLILDEVFGSQDTSRRESILAALRELRALYGQVLLISHVGGIEDAADKVVELRCGADRRLAEVSVL